jgi:LPXTG-site transpeptidase (sortase) family protein
MNRSLSRPRLRRGLLARCAACALVVVISLGQTAASTRASSNGDLRSYVRATGHVLADAFLGYWQQHEGRMTLGLPVSEPVPFAAGRAQFFEYGVLVARCSDGCATVVDRLAVGRELRRAAHDPERTVAGRRVGAVSIAATDASPPSSSETRQTAGGGATPPKVLRSMTDRFERLGGERRFGRPISAPYRFAGRQVQWFEFGRLEDAGGKLTPAPVGLELARALGVSTAPAPRGDLSELDLGRYRLFRGDGTLVPALAPFRPARLKIPSLGIDGGLEAVGIVAGKMGEPTDPWRVGWYPALARPGEGRNVVLAGHKDWWGVGPTVFAALDRLRVGDKLYLIDGDGAGFVYRVRSSRTVPASTNAQEIVRDTGVESVTLITCTGAFDGVEYDSRLVVRAERV